MAHPLRMYLPDVVYEFMSRTVQERYLLRPSEQTRAIILGVLARAQLLYTSVQVYAFVFLSNHYHLLASSDDGAELSQFIGYINSNIARELNRIHRWRGSVWGRRTRPIPVLDPDALIQRLRYLLANGVKERLVRSPREWPGASAVPGLLGDMTLQGIWIERDSLRRARYRDPNVDIADFTTTHELVLSPLPQWKGLPADELRGKYEALVVEIEDESRAAGGQVLGAKRVMRQDPHDAPAQSACSPAPMCHTTSPALRDAFARTYAAFVTEFRTASKAAEARAEELTRALGFPPAAFPRPAWFIRPEGAPLLHTLMRDVAIEQLTGATARL